MNTLHFGLSGFDKKLAIVHNDMKLVTEEVAIFKEELQIIKESITESWVMQET